MRKLFAVVYTALVLGANPGLAEQAVPDAAPAPVSAPVSAPAPAEAAAAAPDPAALREGDMKKLTLHEEPVEVPAIALLRMDEAEVGLADYHGKWVVLNFWATWCAPCRAEMPALDRLQAAMPELVVLPVASGRNDLAAITRFFDEIEVKNIITLRDPNAQLSRQMGVMALPITVILNPAGQEVARLIGDAEWDSDSAKAVLAAMMAAG